MRKNIIFGLRIVFWSLFLGVAFYIALHPLETRYRVQDWWRLRDYIPSDYVSGLANDLTLTNSARRTFYASRPQLESKLTFLTYCQFPEQSFVIGCYDGNRIYVLDVKEHELEAVEPVTAAHELLHAVWARHSSDRKRDLRQQLRAFFEQTDNNELERVIQEYRQAGNDEATIDNELHSIVATEVEKLPPALEKYYQEYFNNRGVIVSLYHSYKDAFERNQREVDKLQSRLQRLQAEIVSLQSQLAARKPTIDANNSQLEIYARNGDVTNHNRLLVTQRRLVDEYNQLVRRYNQLAGLYRELAEQMQTLSLRHSELVNAIDATVLDTIKN